MDRTINYHPESDKLITKERIQYTIADMWLLAPKLRISKIQLTDHMKLKMKKDQSVDTLILIVM